VLIALCIVGILSPLFMGKLEKKAEAEASGADPLTPDEVVDIDVEND
jgi:hypothetical protein